MDIAEKVKEAETYRSMGLLEESILIYEEILSFEFALKDTTRNLFESKVTEIRKELESLENGDENSVTAAEIAIIKDTLSLKDETPQILESASAFMEMDQYRHALAEYEKLFSKKYAWKNAIRDIVECIHKCCGSSGISPAVREMVLKSETEDQNKAEIFFQFGVEMQKRSLTNVAQELCSMARVLDPNRKEIVKWLASIGLMQQHLSIPNETSARQVVLEEPNAIIEISIEFAEETKIEEKAIDRSTGEVVRLFDENME